MFSTVQKFNESLLTAQVDPNLRPIMLGMAWCLDFSPEYKLITRGGTVVKGVYGVSEEVHGTVPDDVKGQILQAEKILKKLIKQIDFQFTFEGKHQPIAEEESDWPEDRSREVSRMAQKIAFLTYAWYHPTLAIQAAKGFVNITGVNIRQIMEFLNNPPTLKKYYDKILGPVASYPRLFLPQIPDKPTSFISKYTKHIVIGVLLVSLAWFLPKKVLS